MKVQINPETQNFKPVTIQLTFETEKDLATFAALSVVGVHRRAGKLTDGVNIKVVDGGFYKITADKMFDMLDNMFPDEEYTKFITD